MAEKQQKTIASYSQVACIGTGLSGIALGATLERWYQMDDIRFFERNGGAGGTWYMNTYPGCACDVPSALYSFSFAPNAGWTKLMPPHQEIKAYQDRVIDQYGLRSKMSFRTEVRQCIWREDASRWLMVLYNLDSQEEFYHECQVLFSASGALVKPRPCDIPGAASFNGALFHSGQWNHNVDLKGKKVVLIGNGCSSLSSHGRFNARSMLTSIPGTAAQIVPAIVDQTESLTQVIRTKHWIFESMNTPYPPLLLWIFQHVPLALKFHRFQIFMLAEQALRMFFMDSRAAKLRDQTREKADKFMRDTAPAKYHDLLIPDFDVGCKRRIFDTGYLKSLHNDKIRLTDSKITEIVPEGIKTVDGLIPADVIVLATGFQTNHFTPFMDIHGKNGTIREHWEQWDGPGAYNTSVLNGFPNFFLLLGPNSATGHTSALMASENAINYAMRILKPVLNGDAASVEINEDAEKQYVYKAQEALQRRIWNAGCNSWYINEKRWNAMAYPWSQAHFWYRSLFPTWSDWTIKKVQKPARSKARQIWLLSLLAVAGGVFAVQNQSVWPAFLAQLSSLKASLPGLN